MARYFRVVRRALLGAKAICSQAFPPAKYVSFLPEWKQKGESRKGRIEGRGEWGKNSS